MSHIRYITDNNVNHFISLLEQANTDGERTVYGKLLVAEEDRYAQEEHRRESIERCIATCSAKIERQSSLLDVMRANRHDTNQADALMSNLLVIRSTLISIRALQ